MRMIYFFFALLLLTDPLRAQPCKVTLLVHTRVGQQEVVLATGGTRALGNWNPSRGLPLQRLNDSLWQGVLKVQAGESVSFKLTKGSWDSEALTHEGFVPDNHSLRVMRDTVVEYAVSRWKDTEPNARTQPHGQVTGEVRYHRALAHPGLLPRDAVVWLPPGYADHPEQRYPVLYMHDAQNIFDPATSTLGYDWRVDEVCDSLIRAGRMEPVIVVGTTCTADRSDDYGYGPKSDAYADFLTHSLKPLIDKEYRTLPAPAHTAVMGSSMGGLISFVLAWEHPEVFGKAGCLSPAFKIVTSGTHLNYLKEMEKVPMPSPPPVLYIDNGTEGLEAVLQPGVDAMMALLTQKNIPFTWYLAQGAEHNEPAWARRVEKPLLLFFGK